MILLYILLCVASTVAYPSPNRPLVMTREGLVRGEVRRSAGGNTFFSFRGIPYARPPVQGLRFRPPERQARWQGVRDAAAHGNRCLQYNVYNNSTKEGSEDCLFANVYTPRLGLGPFSAPLPVMVWVHGGSYSMGSGDDETYGPEYLVDGNVVLVTFNYRLGPFGLFSTFDRSAQGNYATMDQVLLLQWVRDNIATFGGNPHLVTVFGESSGGVSVGLLVLSPLARGLFHRAVLQSGSVLSHWGASGQRTGGEERFARLLNCSQADTAAKVECLRSKSEDEIIDNFRALGADGAIHFQPRVDAEADSPVLPEDPRAILEKGAFNLVPLLIGVTEEEGADFAFRFLQDPRFVELVEANTPESLGLIAGITKPQLLSILDCGANGTVVSSAVLSFYAGNGSLSDNNYLPIVRIFGDRSYNVPMAEEARLAAKYVPVFKYVLDHKGPGRLSQGDRIGLKPVFGPTHTDDLLYLFKDVEFPVPAKNSPAYKMIRFIVSLWTNFAWTGWPQSYAFPIPIWPPFDQHTQRHMRLNSKPSVASHLFSDRVQFWQTLPFNEPWKRIVQTEQCPQ